MRFPNLEMWVRWQRRLWAARQWLDANNPDAIAAHCMFHLNHHARRRAAAHKSYYYALKNQLVQHFYQAGFCESVTLQVQSLPCWSCDGTGVDDWNDGEPCQKCEGTGIYRRHHLYRFVFRVNGRSYVWHQPDGLVTWPVELTSDEQGEYHERDVPSTVESGLTTAIVELYYATVYLYLQQHGYPKPVPYAGQNLRSALSSDWYHLFWGRQWRYKLRRKWRDFVWWLHHPRNSEKSARLGFYEEDEVPF